MSPVPATKPCLLLSLPLEVLQNVLHQVDKKKDLYSLLEACPTLYNIIIPIIWHSISVKVRNNRKMGTPPTGIPRLLSARSKPINRLNFVRELTVQGTGSPQKWCFHSDGRSRSYFREIGAEILLFLSHLKEDSLKHFVWTSGTCVPEELLGLDGYLPAKQRNLETLKLVINPCCSENYTDATSIHLAEFKKLKYFSLEGTKSSEDADAVVHALQASSQTLTELELKLVPKDITTPHLGASWKASKVFALDSADLIWPPKDFIYPRIRRLSLSFMSFEGFEEKFTQAIDFSSLTTLAIRHCRGWGSLFHNIRAKSPMSLRWLEIQYEKVEEGDLDDLVNLLECSPHLENIAVCHGQKICHHVTFKLWEAACFKKVNLRGFIFHMIDVRTELDYQSPRPFESLEFLIATATYIAVPEKNPFTHTNLDFLGLCCNPDQSMQGILLPFTLKKCLRVLHIRKSAIDTTGNNYYKTLLNRFADWAFGDKGISSLECMLFGDFSAKKYRKNVNARYDRTATAPFYEMIMDPQIDDLCPRHKSLATACPSQFGVY